MLHVTCYMLHVTIPHRHQHPSTVLNHHANNCYSAYCNPKDTPAASPRASSRPPACSPSLTKNLLLPPSSPLKKQRKARWIHTKARILLGSETASARAKQGRGSRNGLSKRCFSLYLLLMSFSCQIVLNIIKISYKCSFVQTLFIIFAVFNHIEHDHIIEQAKKNEGK